MEDTTHRTSADRSSSSSRGRHTLVPRTPGIDAMGEVMLPTVARDAAGDGITVALAGPSRRLRDVAPLGARDLTVIDHSAPRPPAADGWAGETDGTPDPLSAGPEERPASGVSGLPRSRGIHRGTRPSAPRPRDLVLTKA